jgi:hypothetical protein
MALDPRIKEHLEQRITRAIARKIEPKLILEKANINRTLLRRASAIVQQKVSRILDTIDEFNPDLVLSKIPSLEFLELLVVSEYLYLFSVETSSQSFVLRNDTDIIAAFKKLLKAYDIYRPEELEVYRELWREIWNASREDSQADIAFEELKEALASSYSSQYQS